MSNHRQTKIQELLLAAADEQRSATARTKDLLTLIRWQKTDIGRPTETKIGRLLRGIRAAAVLRNERDVVEFVDNTYKQLKKYHEKHKQVLIDKRNKKAIERELETNPTPPPGPPYIGFKWQMQIKDCRCVYRMVEVEETQNGI